MQEPPNTAERLPVWKILSELFLDVQFDSHDHRRIAKALAQHPYSVTELEHILRAEVLPAFSSYLTALAGNWMPWSEDRVRRIMKQSRGLSFRALIGRIRAPLRWRMVRHDWKAIAALLADRDP